MTGEKKYSFLLNGHNEFLVLRCNLKIYDIYTFKVRQSLTISINPKIYDIYTEKRNDEV